MEGSRGHQGEGQEPEDPAEGNSLEEAARRYDTDPDFRRIVNGEGAKDLTDADIDWDAFPALEPEE